MEETQIQLKVKDVCREFLQGTWSLVPAENLIVERISAGKSNTLYTCALPETVNTAEPAKVIVRFYGSLATGEGNRYKSMTEAADAVIFSLLAENNFGPRPLGIFNGGRIEEFINSRCLTMEELKEPKTLKLIAKKVAKIHSLNMPLPRRNKLKESLNQMQTATSNLKFNSSWLDNEFRRLYSVVEKFRFNDEINFLLSMYQSIRQKNVFCHLDLHYANFLVPVLENSSKCKDIIVIDYEYSNYNYRGVDIGKFFSERSLDDRRKNKLSFELPSEKECETFAREYLKECKNFSKDLNKDIDNVDNLILESYLGFLVVQVGVIIWNLTNPEVASDIHYMENSYARTQMYQKMKQRLLKSLTRRKKLSKESFLLSRNSVGDG